MPKYNQERKGQRRRWGRYMQRENNYDIRERIMERRRYETEKERPLIVEHAMQLHPKHLNNLKYEFVTLTRQYNILMTYEDKSETMVVRGKYHKVMDWIRHARCLLEIYQEELLQAMETERTFNATVHKMK
ncbi:hypothetical protein Pmani_028083 [Petrolisthes manimaculis]|uniref:Uncharacterized protein n=1 Tax=Petrolisthes manimaculis TaxID=1843537 RepID=A0AAE1TW19_9EUCA|nr:hypothetical protein Pmani_028083 [Petrolisthes manimaculis]